MFWRRFFDRSERLLLTLISKQWLGFGIATWLLRDKYISDQVWVFAFGIVVGANYFQKIQGLDNAATRNTKQSTSTQSSTVSTSVVVNRADGSSNSARAEDQDA